MTHRFVTFQSYPGPQGPRKVKHGEVSLDGKNALSFLARGLALATKGDTSARAGLAGMSLYPPRTVVGIRATRRRDILEERWRHWQNIVDSRKVANAIRATKHSIDGLSAAFERDPPSTFAPYRKTRSALTHESPFEKVFRDATSADFTPARGRAGAAPRVLDAYGKIRHGGAERGCAAEGCVRRDGGARDRPVRSARVETLAPLRSHPPPRAPPGERARGARVRGRGVEGLEVFSVWQAGGARPGGCRRVETLETLGAGRGGDA